MKPLIAMLLLLAVPSAVPQQLLRETSYDWACCEDRDCTRMTTHERYDTALLACLAKGYPEYWIQGGRYHGTPVMTSQTVPSQALLWSHDGLGILGFRIHYGPRADQLIYVKQIKDPDVLAYWPRKLPPGTYYFAMSAFTADGKSSPLSDVVMRTVP